MGHFSRSCKLSGLPITCNTPAVLIVMKMRERLYDNAEEHIRKFGTTSLLSNDGTQVKFQPVWFPIHGTYDEYGGLEGIVEDDNTRLLEKYYNLTIDEIVAIITSGRKDDGYDDALKVIKKPFNLPDDYVEGESWFNRYQRLMNDPMPFGNGRYPDTNGKKEEGYEGWRVIRVGKLVKATKEEYDADIKLIHEQYARYNEWLKTNPDPTDDRKNPQYEDRYKELLTYSAMWVHGEFYNVLTNERRNDTFDKVDLGNPEILEALGFKEIARDKSERYNRRFEKDGLILNSDGTWVNIPKEWIYSLSDLKKYCMRNGVLINIAEMDKKDMTEQIFDYILPKTKSIGQDKYTLADITKATKEYEKLTKEEQNGEKGKEMLKILMNALDMSRFTSNHMIRTIKYLLLNKDEYEFYNPMTIPYFNATKEGKLRDNMVRFWRFNYYMYCVGAYYDVIGTSPQDGEREDVLKMLKIATKILTKEIKERK